MADIPSMVLTVAGIVVVFGVWLDFFTTTMTPSETGLFSRYFSCSMHRLFESVGSLLRFPGWRTAVGPVITISLIVAWFGLSWAGWSLIFLGTEGAVVSSGTKLPAQVSGTIYYVGFTLTTLGTGDFVPGGPLWQILSVITAFNGLTLVTLAITYAIPIVQAVAKKRELSSQFAVWGCGVSALRSHLKSDSSYSSLSDYLSGAAPQLVAVAQQHLAYPMLHFFHSRAAPASLPLQIAVLDEALRELPDEAFARRPELYVVLPNCIRAINEFLVTLSGVYVVPSQDEPPYYREPQRDSIAFRMMEHHSAMALGERRRLLKALIEQDGWSWSRVYQS